jgi:glycosyltransferase involved in cell wall biosynthesis
MKLAFVRNVKYKGRGHGHGFQIGAHTDYFTKKGIKIIDDEKDADVLFALDFSPRIILSALKARLRRKRFIVLCMGKLSEDQNWLNRLLINILANKINVLSRLFREKFIFKSKVEYVSMGLDLKTFSPGENKDNKLILSVGLIDPRKNYKQLLEIARQMPNLRFRIIGLKHNKGYYEHLEKIKPKNVEFLGEVPTKKLLELYRKSKILLHCSKYEMFSGVLQEALACGTPVISFYHPNTESNMGNFIDYARTNEEFIEKISRLLNDKKYYSNKVNEGIRFVNNFPLEVLVKKNYEAVAKGVK